MKHRNRETAESRYVGWGHLTSVALLVAIGLAVQAQQILTWPDREWQALLLYALAGMVFLWGWDRWQRTEAERPRAESAGQCGERREKHGGSPRTRVVLGLLTLALAVLAYRDCAGNTISTLGLLAWLGSILAYSVGALGVRHCARLPFLLYRQAAQAWRRLRRDDLQLPLSRTALLLGGVTLLGAFFRLYRLGAVPPEMTSDHAEKLLDVYDVLRGARPVFFPRNTGREAMQFYLTAVLIRLTPLTIGHLALKVGTALISIVTVPLIYALGRSLYGRRVGLLAAALAGLSRWHVAISRVGLRFPFTPLFTALTLMFFIRALRRNRRGDWLACGLALGIGLHSYTAVRILPLLLVFLTLTKAALDVAARLKLRIGLRGGVGSGLPERTALRVAFWANALTGAGAAVLAALPLLRYWRDQPQMFWFRALTRASDLERHLRPNLWRVFWQNLRDALLMFNYRGGDVAINTVPGDPVLGPVIGGLFVLGVLAALWQVVRRGERRGVYVLLSLVTLLLPSVLSLAFPEENPSAVRAGGAIPVVVILAALSLDAALRALQRCVGLSGGWLSGALLVVLLASGAVTTYDWYFHRYLEPYQRWVWNTTEMGRVVRGFADSVGDLQHAYHIPYARWADTRNIAINAGDITWRNAVHDLDALRAHAADPAAKLYLLHVADRDALQALRRGFPEGRAQRQRSEVPRHDFMIYFVPAREPAHRRGNEDSQVDPVPIVGVGSAVGTVPQPGNCAGP